MGSDLKTELVLLSFLQYGNSNDREFTTELSYLSSQIKTDYPPVPKPILLSKCSIDGDLQTDGNNFSRTGEDPIQIEESDEEIYFRMGRRLAEMGDALNSRIHQEVIDQLVQNLLDEQLSTEESSMRLSSIIDNLMAIVPPGLELEKAKLLLAMLLAKKVASSVPGLLPRVFWTTIGFINQTLHDSIDRLIRHGNV